MSKPVLVDLDLDSVSRVVNALDPISAQDYVTRFFLEQQILNFNSESLPETSTTSTTVDSTKVTLTTPSLPNGNYILEWSFTGRTLAANRAMRVNVKDSATELENHTEFYSNVAAVAKVTGRKKLTGISGIKTFTLNFRVSGSGTTAYMSNALLTLRRIT
jgi:PleD family two-component response regulator